jgi:hypothetical protein
MKTLVNLLLLCLFMFWAGTYVQASGIHTTSSAQTAIKYNRTKVDNKTRYISSNTVLSDENNCVFNAEEEDEEFENEQSLSETRDALLLLLSADSFKTFRKLCHNSFVSPDNSPLYIAQRVLRI